MIKKVVINSQIFISRINSNINNKNNINSGKKPTSLYSRTYPYKLKENAISPDMKIKRKTKCVISPIILFQEKN